MSAALIQGYIQTPNADGTFKTSNNSSVISQVEQLNLFADAYARIYPTIVGDSVMTNSVRYKLIDTINTFLIAHGFTKWPIIRATTELNGYASSGGANLGVVIPQEVFMILGLDEGQAYFITKPNIPASPLGANVATFEQLESAWYDGADWCATGWLSDRDQPMWPTQIGRDYCGLTSGIHVWMPDNQQAGINAFGFKPRQTDVLGQLGGKNVVITRFNGNANTTYWNNPWTTPDYSTLQTLWTNYNQHQALYTLGLENMNLFASQYNNMYNNYNSLRTLNSVLTISQNTQNAFLAVTGAVFFGTNVSGLLDVTNLAPNSMANITNDITYINNLISIHSISPSTAQLNPSTFDPTSINSSRGSLSTTFSMTNLGTLQSLYTWLWVRRPQLITILRMEMQRYIIEFKQQYDVFTANSPDYVEFDYSQQIYDADLAALRQTSPIISFTNLANLIQKYMFLTINLNVGNSKATTLLHIDTFYNRLYSPYRDFITQTDLNQQYAPSAALSSLFSNYSGPTSASVSAPSFGGMNAIYADIVTITGMAIVYAAGPSPSGSFANQAIAMTNEETLANIRTKYRNAMVRLYPIILQNLNTYIANAQTLQTAYNDFRTGFSGFLTPALAAAQTIAANNVTTVPSYTWTSLTQMRTDITNNIDNVAGGFINATTGIPKMMSDILGQVGTPV